MTALTLKTRFAPSPTGYLHLGNVRTALFNALLARQQDGIFLLRLEDTDRERSLPEYSRALLEDLRWLSLEWQEGPEVGGPHGPYTQSERQVLYRHYYALLEQREQVYPCFCPPAELALVRKTQLSAGQPPRYSGACARLSEAEREARRARGLPATLRFRIPPGRVVEFHDLVRGPQRFSSDDIGDFIIRRADGGAQFFFTNAVDDALMEITHVLRGEDHLTNTPRQLLLLEALQLPAPEYGHIALIVGADGSPLSKRHGSRSLRELREAGFLPDAVNNYLARLGHTYDSDGWMEPAELAAGFAVGHLGRAPARYDEAQLLHWQAEAVARRADESLQIWMGTAVWARAPADRRDDFIAAVRPNVRFPADALDWAERLFGTDLALDGEARAAIESAGNDFFRQALAAYTAHGAAYQPLVEQLKAATGARGKALFLPLRAALTGLTHGPELARILALIPAELARRRLQTWC